MNEYIPNGFTNMTEYNRHNEKVAKVKYWIQGICGALIFAAGLIANAAVDVL